MAPRREAWLGIAAAALLRAAFAIPGRAAAGGFFAAGGAMALIVFWALAAWRIAVAMRMLRAPAADA